MVCMLSKVSGALGHRASMGLKRVRRDQLDIRRTCASLFFLSSKRKNFRSIYDYLYDILDTVTESTAT